MTRSSNRITAIRLRGVSKRYESNGRVYPALTDIDFEAYRGNLHLLLGPSGSGKTTLLTVAAGFVAPTAGTVEIFGEALYGRDPRELQLLRAATIGFIFQTFLLIDGLNVAENVALQLRFAGIANGVARRRTLEALERVGIAGLAEKRPRELSHGERQRIAIARALAIDADVLIADEPTASLDAEQGESIIRILHTCATDMYKCVIVASHDQRLRHYADEVVTMVGGRIAG
ncbi:MAG: ABC transporter ATP-binding protein, partial [Bacteroidota bacterium]|nr:ABC transporter ATP-binding protein [Bacteroidota bacterium]